MRKTDIRAVLEMILYFALVAGITFLIIHFVGQRTVVNGVSMQPTLSDGDNLIVDKLSYRFRNPDRFDIIVFPQGDGRYFIKRIIGLPGENVRIDEDGSIYIDGEKLSESYGKEVIQDPGLAKDGIELGADEYFVLGDNRNDSMDSRMAEVGPIVGERIMGRAWLRIYPFDEIGFLKHGS
ncbi:MAG TPA: signal peptidase I [Roseburia sp.]|nr:signal peptidase I [Roseburia sp.]